MRGTDVTEGPVAGPDGNSYFSDIPENRIYRIVDDGAVEVYLGRLYVTTVAGLQVFDEAGSYLETI